LSGISAGNALKAYWGISMEKNEMLEYLERQIEDKKKDDLDTYLGHFIIIALLVVITIGAGMMPNRTEYLVSIFLMIFGSLGIGYVFGFERGRKVEK
jgi:hypothetical protein